MAKWIELNNGELVNLNMIYNIKKETITLTNDYKYSISFCSTSDAVDEIYSDESECDKRFKEIKAMLLDRANETDMQPVKVIAATDIMIEEMDLSVRAYNCLKRAGVRTLDDVIRLGSDRLLEVRNLGKKCYDEIVWILVNRYHQPQRNWASRS